MKDYDRFREEKRQYSYRWIAQHGVPVKKGLKELLIYLKGRNIKTAVATASSESWASRAMSGEPGWKTISTITYTGTW